MSNTYTVALLADVHGNLLALEAVIEDLKQHTIDEFVFVGDLVMNGPRPKETLNLIRNLKTRSVIGNTDLEVVKNIDIVGQWTRRHLDDDDILYFEGLPITERITPPGKTSPQNDLLICHSTPRDPFDLLILEIHPLGTSFTEVTAMEEAYQMINGNSADLIVYGHIHYPSTKVINEQPVASIGSVGFPFDGDRRAAYTIASWTAEMWELTEYRVSYEHEQVARELETSTIPFPSRYARMIREANWFPRE